MSDFDFPAAFHAHKDVVYRFALRMTGSPTAAEDVVQECFLALWRKPEGYDPSRGTLRSFLLGISRKLILRGWRNEHPQDPLEDDTSICAPLDLAGRERAETVASAVRMLPPMQREAVILFEYEEMSLEEIARATDAEIAAVKSRLSRARTNLRRMLAPLMEKGTVYGSK